MTFELRNKEINSQCAELLVRPLYITIYRIQCIVYNVYFDISYVMFLSSTLKFISLMSGN